MPRKDQRRSHDITEDKAKDSCNQFHVLKSFCYIEEISAVSLPKLVIYQAKNLIPIQEGSRDMAWACFSKHLAT